MEQDTESLADFIKVDPIDAGRMASPVSLPGVSYGGFRAATITYAPRIEDGAAFRRRGPCSILACARISGPFEWRGLRPAARGARPPL